jgi:hypothetical protein
MFLSLRQQNHRNENVISAGHGEAFDKKYQKLNLAAVKRKIFKNE